MISHRFHIQNSKVTRSICTVVGPDRTISVLLKVSVTIPVSAAGVERSFSRLMLTKTYLCSTMGQERLSSLSLLSTHLKWHIDSFQWC